MSYRSNKEWSSAVLVQFVPHTLMLSLVLSGYRLERFVCCTMVLKGMAVWEGRGSMGTKGVAVWELREGFFVCGIFT